MRSSFACHEVQAEAIHPLLLRSLLRVERRLGAHEAVGAELSAACAELEKLEEQLRRLLVAHPHELAAAREWMADAACSPAAGGGCAAALRLRDRLLTRDALLRPHGLDVGEDDDHATAAAPPAPGAAPAAPHGLALAAAAVALAAVAAVSLLTCC